MIVHNRGDCRINVDDDYVYCSVISTAQGDINVDIDATDRQIQKQCVNEVEKDYVYLLSLNVCGLVSKFKYDVLLEKLAQ